MIIHNRIRIPMYWNGANLAKKTTCTLTGDSHANAFYYF